jgi:arginine:ornithine antiporter/lysine permease
MIYAGGMKFILLSAILYAPGTVLYIWARREQNSKVFKPSDLAIFAIAAIGAVVGIYGLVSGLIQL